LKKPFVYVLFRPTAPSDSERGFAFLFFGFRDNVSLLSALKRKNGRLTDEHAVLVPVCPVKFLNQLIFTKPRMKAMLFEESLMTFFSFFYNQ
jgi:hypothetical protein